MLSNNDNYVNSKFKYILCIRQNIKGITIINCIIRKLKVTKSVNNYNDIY